MLRVYLLLELYGVPSCYSFLNASIAEHSIVGNDDASDAIWLA
jgi:hypothetical protein